MKLTTAMQGRELFGIHARRPYGEDAPPALAEAAAISKPAQRAETLNLIHARAYEPVYGPGAF